MQLVIARQRHALGCRSRRIWYLFCCCILALTAALSLSLTVYTIRFDDALARLMAQPTLRPPLPPPSNSTTSVAPTEGDHPKVFCIVVTVWLLLLVVVSLSLWGFVELVVWPRESQLIVNIAWFSILYEIYERFVAAEQGNIRNAIQASTRDAAAASAAAAAIDANTTLPPTLATTQETSHNKSS